MEYYYLKDLDSESKNESFGQIASSSLLTKKSKFYSYVYYIDDEIKAELYINLVRRNNKDARHIVYAYSYILDGLKVMRYSEDGEPQGTATKAIVEYIDRESITNICIIIVRYFGGILLGSGPLTRAYFNVANESIKMCKKERLYEYKKYLLECDYDKYKEINLILNKHIDSGLVRVIDTKFTDMVVLDLLIEKDNYDNISSELIGRN